MKCKRLQEVISDPDHRLVRKLKEEHGRPGEEGYAPWCRDGDCVKRHEDADFPVYLGGWDQDPNYAEYHGYDERSIDPRFCGGRSRLAFSSETGEPWFGVRMPAMTRVCWKLFEYMGSSNDRRCRHLKPALKNLYYNVSKIATKLLRGHGYQKHLEKEADCLSVRWSALCRAITHDRAYYEHPDGAQVNSQRILSALKYGGQGHPRFLFAFQCDEYGWSKHDEYDRPGGIKRHVWPVWDGLNDCSTSDHTERNGGVLHVKAVGGHIGWIGLGRKDKVTAHHADHYLSIYSQILRDFGYYPGPAMYHTPPSECRTTYVMLRVIERFFAGGLADKIQVLSVTRRLALHL